MTTDPSAISGLERIEQLGRKAWEDAERAESARLQAASQIVSWEEESNIATKYAIAAGSWAAVAAALVALPSGDTDELISRVIPCSDAVNCCSLYKDMALRAAVLLSDRIQDEGHGTPESEPEECGAWEAARVARREWRDASASMVALSLDVQKALEGRIPDFADGILIIPT